MKDFDNAYGYDAEMAKGHWFTVNGIKTKLAYSNEPAVIARVEEMRGDKEVEKGANLTDEEFEEIGKEAFLERVLLDWETSDGTECTTENKQIVMSRYPQYINDCMVIAQNNKKFKEKRLDETVGK